MNPTLRWILLPPTVALTVAISWLTYPLGRNLALLACPHSLLGTESTTDFSHADYSVTSTICAAGWFPAADGLFMIFAITLSVVTAGFVGYHLTPSHRRLSAAASSMLAIGLVIAAFAHEP